MGPNVLKRIVLRSVCRTVSSGDISGADWIMESITDILPVNSIP